MHSRIDLQTVLEGILGSRNVYFQPPASVKMSYPAIVYSRKNFDNRFANNSIYKHMTAYEITVIDKNPDTVIIDKMFALQYCSFDRHYTADNLNHDVFTLYF